MNDQQQSNFQSRRYLVDSRFQIKYTMFVVVLSSVVFAILGYKLYQLNMTNTEILQIKAGDIAEMVKEYDRGLLYILGGFFLLQVASLFVLGILITHRIAGPMYRVNRVLEEVVRTGKVQSLQKVRSRDEFMGFFGTLGEVLDVLETKHLRAQESLQRLEQALSENATQEVREEIKYLQENV